MADIHQINLIPPEILEERMNRLRIRKWSILITCQVICFCLLGIFFYGYLRRLESRANMLRRSSREIKEGESRLVLAYENVRDLAQKRESLLGMVHNQRLTPVLLSLAEAMDPKTRLVGLWVERGKAIDRESTGGGGVTHNYYILKLSGISRSYQSLSNFLLHLQQNKSFQQIRLIKSDMDEKDRSLVGFEIALTYREIEQT
ncbi:MAG: PilN domain-containing protein [bacterium]